MKKTYLSAAITAFIPSFATLASWFRNTRTRLLAVTMSLATVTQVFGQPMITNQPQSQSVSLGANVTFSVAASGDYEPFSYQWRRNEMDLAGETNDTLILTNVQLAHAGSYSVVVSDVFEDSTTSEAATLTVDPTFTKVLAGPGSDIGSSRGGAWGDYDNDGFIDLFVAQIGPGGGGPASQFLYHNNRDGTFSRVTNGPIAAVLSAGRGAAWGDYDNDGYLDLVLVNTGEPNYLFHNNGDGSFTEVPDAAVVSDIADSRGVSWVDYDNDGYLDLFRTTFDEPRRLYQNNHDGTFTPITQGDFLTVPGTFFGVAWGDYNNDGRPDLFLPQADEQTGLPSYLYRNDGGGTFTRVAAGTLDGTFNSPAAAWADYDNDGDLDLFVSCAWPPGDPGDQSRPNLFYRNDGNDAFTSLASLPANDPENQGGASLAGVWGDYDNDGWLDLFVANRLGQNNFLYHNNGDGTFNKITTGSLVNDGGDSLSAAWGDYDNDGFLDLFVSNFDGVNFLYHNNGNTNHWLKFRLIGTRSNRAAIGAKVRLHATINGQSFWQMREVPGGDRSQNSLHVHFGLGNATNADLVRIEWPSGAVQELRHVASKQFLSVTEPGGEPQLAATQENGQVQLTLTGKQGSRYAIETSTGLTDWTSAALTVTVTNQSGAATFPAPDAPSAAQRFYRAVWQ